MATTAELSTIISNRLRPKIVSELVWADITSAVVNLPPSDKDAIVAAVKQNDAAEIGTIVFKGVRAYVEAEANTEATTMMADNTLNFNELDRILS